MTTNRKKSIASCKKYGWNHKTFFNRPHWTRRRFFEVMGAGVTASFLARALCPGRRRDQLAARSHQEHRART